MLNKSLLRLSTIASGSVEVNPPIQTRQSRDVDPDPCRSPSEPRLHRVPCGRTGLGGCVRARFGSQVADSVRDSVGSRSSNSSPLKSRYSYSQSSAAPCRSGGQKNETQIHFLGEQNRKHEGCPGVSGSSGPR